MHAGKTIMMTVASFTTRWHVALFLALASCCIHNEKAGKNKFCPVLVRRKKPVAMTTRTVCSSRWESDARC